MICSDVGQKPEGIPEEFEQAKAPYTQQSLEISPSKINGDRSPARIIASKQGSMVDNYSQISVPLGFVNPEGDAEKDLTKKNEQIAKTDLLQTEAADLPEGEEEQQNSQMVNQEHSSPEKIDLVQSSDKMACEMD